MTLKQVITMIEFVAHKQPSVNMIVQNDIFRLNSYADARYGVFGWTQGVHSTSIDSNVFNYQFTFYYIDRLTNDQRNQIEVQSVGVQTLDNIIRKLDSLGVYVDTDYRMQTFNQRFLDECAGAFCTVTLSAPVSSTCEESYGDFIESDFNDDFLIY